MADPQSLLIGLGEKPVHLLPKYGNRHGLIAGATGTGKTVTLQGLAEGFSDLGVPVFLADVKGDLAGLAYPGATAPHFIARAQEVGMAPYEGRAYPTLMWDLFGRQGHPIRTTISEIGPLLMSRMLSLNETQEGVLNIAFSLADEEGLLLLDLKDLREMLAYVGERASELTRRYGNVSSASVGAIQRALLVLEQQGGNGFFGEPALDLADMMRTTTDGRGVISVLASSELYQSPRLYSTFLLWLLSELFEELPEVGDLDKPKLVFFFDEAHLLFNDAPKALVEKVEQVVRLIRSKGVGVYFVTQNPIDIPDTVLGQLGNRVQHALRAFTPRDQKAVASAAETFRPNPKINVAQAITELPVGVALVSVLEEKGIPSMVDIVKVRPPFSRVGTITPEERQGLLNQSPVGAKYNQTIERESAYERIRAMTATAAPPQAAPQGDPAGPTFDIRYEIPGGQSPAPRPRPAPAPRPAPQRRSDSVVEAVTKSVLRSAGSSLGREIVRGILGGIFGGSRRRR